MTPEQFVFWIQGHLELNPTTETLTKEQVATIREHLELVFEHSYRKTDKAKASDLKGSSSGLDILTGGGRTHLLC